MVEVNFEPDEQKLLDWIRANVSPDGTVAISDTALITKLGWTQEQDRDRFFKAKMRLTTAGIIRLYVDGNGRSLIELNEPRERAASTRYVFAIIPLQVMPQVRSFVAQWKRGQLPQAQKPGPRPPFKPGMPGHRVMPPVAVKVPMPAGAKVPRHPDVQAAKPQPPKVSNDTAPKVSNDTGPGKRPPHDHSKAQAIGQQRLGVRPVAAGPLRPPLLKNAKTA